MLISAFRMQNCTALLRLYSVHVIRWYQLNNYSCNRITGILHLYFLNTCVLILYAFALTSPLLRLSPANFFPSNWNFRAAIIIFLLIYLQLFYPCVGSEYHLRCRLETVFHTYPSTLRFHGYARLPNSAWICSIRICFLSLYPMLRGLLLVKVMFSLLFKEFSLSTDNSTCLPCECCVLEFEYSCCSEDDVHVNIRQKMVSFI